MELNRKCQITSRDSTLLHKKHISHGTFIEHTVHARSVSGLHLFALWSLSKIPPTLVKAFVEKMFSGYFQTWAVLRIMIFYHFSSALVLDHFLSSSFKSSRVCVCTVRQYKFEYWKYLKSKKGHLAAMVLVRSLVLCLSFWLFVQKVFAELLSGGVAAQPVPTSPLWQALQSTVHCD